jgi:hypothetical protein
MPARSAFAYTFENIANVIDRIAAMIGLRSVEAAHTKNQEFTSSYSADS